MLKSTFINAELQKQSSRGVLLKKVFLESSQTPLVAASGIKSYLSKVLKSYLKFHEQNVLQKLRSNRSLISILALYPVCFIYTMK